MSGRLGRLGVVYLTLIYLFLFFPAILVVVFSFNNSRFWAFPLRGFTLRWYEELLERPDALDAFYNSVIVAIPTVLLSIAFGTAIALAFHRWSVRIKPVAEAIILMPLLIPTLIWSLALLISLNYLSIRTGAITVVIGQVLYTTPFSLLLVSARFRTLDPNLEDAARSLGAGNRVIFVRIVLPHIAPALLASALMVFAISFSDLVIAFFLGGTGFTTLPVFIYSLIQIEPSPVINSVSTFIFAVGVGCVLFAYLAAGREAVVIGEKGGP